MNPDSDNTPPSLAQRFLRWFLRDDLAEEVQGDLKEKFYATVEDHSLRRAKLNYWYQVLHYLRPFAIRNLTAFHQPTHYAMYRNYFKISWRNTLRYKGYSLINISGLAIGMMVAILIGLWLYDELSFNKYHENYDRIAWVMQNQTFDEVGVQTNDNQPLQLAPELRENYGTYFEHIVMTSFRQGRTLRKDDKALTKTGIYTEAAAPDMLTLRMRSGTRQGLIEPNSVLLSASNARAFFGDQDPINEVLLLGNREVKVTGVYEDLPDNSSFADIEFIAPWELYLKDLPDWLSWGNNWFQTIVQVAQQADMQQASAAIRDAKKKRVTEDEGARFNPELFLQPMSRVYLHSEFEQGVSVGGRIRYVWLFGIIGAFVLLLACINFTNLSTARSEKRAKEIGVRKAIGSLRSQLISQFFTESLLLATLAFVLATLLVHLILPAFNEVAGKRIEPLWLNPWFWGWGLGLIGLTGTLAGTYPAVYLSSLKAARMLKGPLRTGRMAALPRSVLVVVQFVVSVSLIIGTVIVFQQIQFVKNRPLGYNVNALLLLNTPFNANNPGQQFETFRNNLLQTGSVAEVAKSEALVTDAFVTNSGLDWSGKPPGMQDEFVTMRISHEFGKTIDWNVVKGRDFSRNFATDSMSFVINEVAAEYMGLDNPIGEQVDWGEAGVYTIVGVVEDMITQSPYAPVKPMIFSIDYDRTDVINIKLRPEVSMQQALADVEAVYKMYDPATPFAYRFADEQYAQKFATEARIGKLSGFFALLAILISCLGLFGLASFIAEQRTKEIGIRKVLGASVSNLWQLLSRDFVVLVAISCLLAIPVAYYFAHEWLQNYEYRTALHWWVFAGAGLGAVVITLLTVSYQTVRAALANPVKSLRSE